MSLADAVVGLVGEGHCRMVRPSASLVLIAVVEPGFFFVAVFLVSLLRLVG